MSENEQSSEIGGRLKALGLAWIGAFLHDSLMENPLSHAFFIELRGEVMALEYLAESRERERALLTRLADEKYMLYTEAEEEWYVAKCRYCDQHVRSWNGFLLTDMDYVLDHEPDCLYLMARAALAETPGASEQIARPPGGN